MKDKITALIPAGSAVLAPTAGVTDLPFRVLCREFGCALTYTEMVSAKGMHYKNAGTLRLVESDPAERPCAVQLFGAEPEIMAETAAAIEQDCVGAVGLIDINMGCPVPKVTRNGEGSALMRDVTRASAVIQAVARAVRLPVTVKFRKGWDEDSVNAEEFARMAQESGAAALCVHGRTREQFYHGAADWDIIGRVRDAVDIPVIGNGDVFTAQAARDMLKSTGCHAVMVARGARGNPWIFKEIASGEPAAPTAAERVDMALRHARMAAGYKGERVAVREMRKHVAWYIKGCRGAARVRAQVNSAGTLAELEAILEGYRIFLEQEE